MLRLIEKFLSVILILLVYFMDEIKFQLKILKEKLKRLVNPDAAFLFLNANFV